MDKSETKISFSLVWLVIYLIGLKVSSILSEGIGIPNLCNAIFRILFVVILILYLKRTNLLAFYGINTLRQLDIRNLLYFIPFLLLAGLGLCFGVYITDTFGQIVLGVLNVLCVGFIEEMIFRSFLFKALIKKGTVFAMVISSSVFGLIHFVNLLGGADLLYTLLQVISACAIGFVFTIFFYKTGNIIPCILCHSLYDVCYIFSSGEINEVNVIYGISIVVSLVYGVYLLKTKKPLIVNKDEKLR